MIGGTFNGHPWNAGDTVAISVHDTKHPASRMWGDEFTIKDEIYQYQHWQPEKVHVLMSLDMAKCKPKRPYQVPISWVKDYGQGKVFYTNLGHREETWTDKRFLASVEGCREAIVTEFRIHGLGRISNPGERARLPR